VYDSEEEEEGPSDHNLTQDKKKVLKFFNEGSEQELTGIQVRGSSVVALVESTRLIPLWQEFTVYVWRESDKF
jgi:hypothetical protein